MTRVVTIKVELSSDKHDGLAFWRALSVYEDALRKVPAPEGTTATITAGEPSKPRANKWGPPDSHGKPFLPTPCTQTQAGGVRIEGGSGARKVWQETLALRATPAARDWKDTSVSPSNLERNSLTLPIELQTGLGRSQKLGTAELLDVSAWMMGYPKGWLDHSLRPTAIASSRKSRKSSDAPSPRSSKQKA